LIKNVKVLEFQYLEQYITKRASGSNRFQWKATSKLNGIVHPAVKKNFDHWLENHSKDSFMLYEATILFESGGYKKLP
jgi:dephospho-CoA kinase